MRALSGRERRLVAVGLLLLMLALLQYLVLAPLIGGFIDRSHQRAALLDTYQRNERLIAGLPSLRRRAEQNHASAAGFAILAPNAGLAGDRLKERLRNQLIAAGGQLVAIQDIASRPGWVGAAVDAQIGLDQLEKLLLNLQNLPPYLVIDMTRISADRALQSGHLEPLDIRIEVSAPFGIAAS